jgi:hypothetical protein
MWLQALFDSTYQESFFSSQRMKVTCDRIPKLGGVWVHAHSGNFTFCMTTETASEMYWNENLIVILCDNFLVGGGDMKDWEITKHFTSAVQVVPLLQCYS